MKITCLLIMVFASSLFAGSAKSQLAKVTLSMKNTTITEVIDAIEHQTDYLFVYDKNEIDLNRKVSVEAEKKAVAEVLSNMFDNSGVAYAMEGSNIMLMQKSAVQQVKKITGKVTEASGAPLAGVTVVVKGTTIGVITDAEGKYSISGYPENAILQFSFVGMIAQEIAVKNSTTINVTLLTDSIGMDEVVVVGYGTQKKVNLTGSVGVVNGDKLVNRSAPNISKLIQGASPNLNINLTNSGGEPGASSTWNIRGMGSISGGSSPLILIDGVESNIENVDPEAIESISILKDASASAIYGARAPFGVILLTTKKGSKNQPIRIQYNNNLSFDSPLSIPHFVDSYTWVDTYNHIQSNSGLAPVYPAEQVERVKGYIAGTYKTEYNPDKPPVSIWRGRWDGNANYDWPSEYYKKSAFTQKHNVNVEGGGEKTQYYISSGYFDQGGLFSWGNDLYKRYNVMANFSSQINDWIRFDYSSKYSRTETDRPLGIVGQPRSYILRSFLSFGPLMPKYNIDGTLSNPLVRALQSSGREHMTNNDLGITLRTELQPVKGWKTNISYNYNYGGATNLQNPKPVIVQLPTGKTGNIGAPMSGSVENLAVSYYTLANAVTSYEKTIGSHYFKAMAGYEQEVSTYRGLTGSKMELITETVPSINTALGAVTLSDAISHWATQSVFGRLNYNYKEKYLFEFSSRYNGSSKFAKDSRWGFFPSVSGGYNIAKENFWKSLDKYIPMLKFRASYGSLGNQNVSNYAYLSSVPVSSNMPFIIGTERPVYAGVPAIIPADLTWETVTTLNGGFDAGFLNNRLQVTGDWFNRKVTDMIGPVQSLPAVLGTGAPWSNNAEMQTQGFEITFDWKDKISDALSYNIGFSIGDSKSKILKYKNDSELLDTWYNGKNVGEIWGFVSDKLIQTAGEEMPDQTKYYKTWGPGDMKYKDLNNDKIINDGTRTLKDRGDLKVIGNSTPRYNFGITGGLNWKGFDMSMFWQGIGKRDYLINTTSNMYFGIVPGGSAGSESALFKNSPGLDFWRPADDTSVLGPNTDAYFPKPYFTTENDKNRAPQSHYVLNAAYLRLKNIQIGYTIPQRLSMKAHLYKARFYASGENLITFTKLPGILDPETTIASDPAFGGREMTGAIYPISKGLSFGVNLTF